MCVYAYNLSMALVPSHQLYPRTTRLSFLRYSSSSPFKKPNFHTPHDVVNQDCIFKKSPPKRSNFVVTPHDVVNQDCIFEKTTPKRSNFVVKASSRKWNLATISPNLKSKESDTSVFSSSWLGKWNETRNEIKLQKPQIVLNYRNNNGGTSGSDCEESSSGSTMDRIVEKLKKFGYADEGTKKEEKINRDVEKGSIEDIFFVEEGILPNVRGGFSEESPFGDENVIAKDGVVRFPWEKPLVKKVEGYSMASKSRTHLAELTLPASELRRLTNLALRIKNKTRITGAGVTQQIVETIHEKWRTSEVVRLKVEGAPALNMKRMHEILEVSQRVFLVVGGVVCFSFVCGVLLKFKSSD